MKTGAKGVLHATRYFLIPYLLLLCTCLVLKLLYSRADIYFAVNSLYSAWADAAAPYITDLGDGITIIVISLLLTLYSYRNAFLLFTSYLITSAVAQLLKYGFDAPRPRVYFEKELSRIHFVKNVYIHGSHSFPSGHTVTAFSAGVVLTYLIRERMWGLLCLLMAVLVGYSRMYLSQHFFEDVTVGSAIGAFVTVLWLGYIDQRKFIKSPRWNRGIMKI
ncbi:PAP2 family protein [Mucilaginibacter terrenus]|uniref:PAP2 family protein n=1 Tax=Mucilaginibacter terrenus TaxID=2482727 RepID=A0A3E2NY66_9SPHI|nr:phosphatase PAP2 family protein [Mucilaginibacter terrenus]RFZ85861.1 PAP2 family protein [Mucilaginibacter terrenus]